MISTLCLCIIKHQAVPASTHSITYDHLPLSSCLVLMELMVALEFWEHLLVIQGDWKTKQTKWVHVQCNRKISNHTINSAEAFVLAQTFGNLFSPHSARDHFYSICCFTDVLTTPYPILSTYCIQVIFACIIFALLHLPMVLFSLEFAKMK